MDTGMSTVVETCSEHAVKGTCEAVSHKTESTLGSIPKTSRARKSRTRRTKVTDEVPCKETKRKQVISDDPTSVKRDVSEREELVEAGDVGKKKRGTSAGHRNADLGRRGEEAAARFLDRRGYDIVERNWTCKAGEADIIARDGEALVFVEVKTRSSAEKGFPAEAVNAAKRRRYERIAALFLQDYDVVDVPVRFDVVSIMVVAPDRALIRHHINAFAAG